MWQIENRTPFAAERGWVRDRDGTEIWLVVVKATFDILPDGGTRISSEQVPVWREPVYHGEPGRSSIKYEADLVLTKASTDILVVGHAHAPAGQRVREMDVAFRVGPVQKVLRVFGDRRWGTLGPSEPEPFERMPLVYERAFGGVDKLGPHPDRDFYWPNPVGTGYASEASRAHAQPLPNVEYPDRRVSSWDDRPEPAGFGVIACHWQPRVGFAGTYDDHWMKTRQPLLAEDLDDRYFQAAPADQQAPTFLRGGEPVACQGLGPHGPLRFELPRVSLGFETRFRDGSREIHQNRCLHTVILEPDAPRVSLVWHSALPCHSRVHKLRETLITLKAQLGARRPAAVPEVQHG